MELRIGQIICGRYFSGEAEVLDIDGNDLEVRCSTTLNNNKVRSWTETWNLKFTIQGFARKEYWPKGRKPS